MTSDEDDFYLKIRFEGHLAWDKVWSYQIDRPRSLQDKQSPRLPGSYGGSDDRDGHSQSELKI